MSETASFEWITAQLGVEADLGENPGDPGTGTGIALRLDLYPMATAERSLTDPA